MRVQAALYAVQRQQHGGRRQVCLAAEHGVGTRLLLLLLLLVFQTTFVPLATSR